MLRSEEELTTEGGFCWAAVERFFGGETREIGIVILLREMREDEIARAGIEAVRVGEILADRVIRKMAGAAEDALLDDPRIRADLEHVEIVIGFENQAIGLAEMYLDELGHVTEVGHDSEFGAVGAEGEGDGIGSIVRNA